MYEVLLLTYPSFKDNLIQTALPDWYRNRWLQTSQTAPPSQIYHQTDIDRLAVVFHWLLPACWWLWSCCRRCSRIVHSPSHPHWSGIFAGQPVGLSDDTGWSRWSLHSAGSPSWGRQQSHHMWNWPVLSHRGSLPTCSNETITKVQYVLTVIDLEKYQLIHDQLYCCHQFLLQLLLVCYTKPPP